MGGAAGVLLAADRSVCLQVARRLQMFETRQTIGELVSETPEIILTKEDELTSVEEYKNILIFKKTPTC